MIKTKNELKEFIERDKLATGRTKINAHFFGDEIWKFQLAMRHLDYYCYRFSKNKLFLIPYFYYKMRYHNLSLKLGFSIPFNAFDKGLSLPHYGTIVINNSSQFGENCRIHTCVNIGASGGSKRSPIIGNNVYIGPGAKLVGDISIADGVCIGAGALVVKSIEEPNTTWGGCPAKKISDNSSREHLSPLLFK